MADTWYDEGRNGLIGGGVHADIVLDHDIRVGLRDEGTTAVNVATQVDLADISSALVDQSDALASITVGVVGVGVFDHDDETISAVTGATVESLDYYDYDTATDSTSPLLWNIDGWTGLPLTPNGGDVTLAPAAGGVYALNAT